MLWSDALLSEVSKALGGLEGWESGGFGEELNQAQFERSAERGCGSLQDVRNDSVLGKVVGHPF